MNGKMCGRNGVSSNQKDNISEDDWIVMSKIDTAKDARLVDYIFIEFSFP